MDRLESMGMIVSVAEAGSLSAASRKLNVPVPTVSRKLADLEAHLSVQLFQRSSRRLSLTEAGRTYVEACRRIIEQVEDAEREASGEYRTPTGDLAVTSPWGIGHQHLVPLACAFAKTYPDIRLRLLMTDRVLSMAENAIDVGVRIGPLPDSSLVATRIGSIRVVCCASPAYLAVRGQPATLDDLSRHDCITIDDLGAPNVWKFARNGLEIAAPIRSNLTVNTSEAAVEAAALGAGIARVMSYKMEPQRQAGTLSIIMQAFERDPLPVHLLHIERKPMPLKLRVFLDWIAPRLKARLAPPVAR